jgi:hypothetical protein
MLRVLQDDPRFWHVSADYSAARTNVTVQAAPGAGLRLVITWILISNGAVAGNVTLLDGSAGTVLLEDYPPINGGLCLSNIKIALTANTLLAITSTSCTTHSITVGGFTESV